jgi:ubiquinone/menaquinone biosynthesis C-methylase UbiE
MPIEFDARVTAAMEEHRTTATASSKVQRYLELLAPAAGERVLDLGCGGGWFGRMLAPLVVAPTGCVVGVDRSAEAVDLAVQLSAGAEYPALSFECGDAHALRFANGAFDAAACISVLAFCDDPTRVLAELQRVLRPGGRLVVANSDEETRVYRGLDDELGRTITRGIANRARHPSLGRELSDLLVANGFQIVEESILTDQERHFRPGMSGFTLAHACRDYMLSAGVNADDYERWLADLRACDVEGSYQYCVTTYAYLCRR